MIYYLDSYMHISNTVIKYCFLCHFFKILERRCPDLSSPTNGVVNADIVNKLATYSCSAGYNLNGFRLRTCDTNGEWSGSVPTCGKQPAVIFE